MNGGEDSYAETPLQLASAAGRCHAALPSKRPHCPMALSAPPHSSPTLAGPVARYLALKALLWAPGDPRHPTRQSVSAERAASITLSFRELRAGQLVAEPRR